MFFTLILFLLTHRLSITEKSARPHLSGQHQLDGQVDQINGIRNPRKWLPYAERQEPVDRTAYSIGAGEHQPSQSAGPRHSTDRFVKSAANNRFLERCGLQRPASENGNEKG